MRATDDSLPETQQKNQNSVRHRGASGVLGGAVLLQFSYYLFPQVDSESSKNRALF